MSYFVNKFVICQPISLCFLNTFSDLTKSHEVWSKFFVLSGKVDCFVESRRHTINIILAPSGQHKAHSNTNMLIVLAICNSPDCHSQPQGAVHFSQNNDNKRQGYMSNNIGTEFWMHSHSLSPR